MMRLRAAVLLLAALSGCRNDGGVPGDAELKDHVRAHRVGSNPDQWIEMLNAFGEWERTGLIFGYADDYGECAKAIAGLHEANPGREYRCTPAN